jgi:hypothetical protein
MSEEVAAADEGALEARLQAYVGKPLGGTAAAPDDVNLPMIRHWVDALDDRNAAYDEERATSTRFGRVVAPPAMLQTWTMGRPKIEGIAERGGAPGEMSENPITVLDEAGYTATLATNSELHFERYLRLGDRLESSIEFESISKRKKTALGFGYFVTWVATYTDGAGEVVGSQLFRILKFDPSTYGAA